MRLKFLATASAPLYTIDGETVNGVDLSTPHADPQQGIRAAWRDESGELHVELCQMPPVTRVSKVSDGRLIETRGGHWTESDWIDASEYDSETLYIQPVDMPAAPYLVEP